MDVELSGPVRRLVADVAAVAAQVPAELPGGCALADLQALLVQSDRLRAVLLGRIADVELRQLHALDGASSTSAWVQAQPCAAGRDEVALARRLHRMPHVHQQVLAGELALGTAELVGAALDKAARHLDRPDGRIDGHDGEQVLRNLIIDGVLQLCCEGVGGLADDDPALHRLLDELVTIVQLPLSQVARIERAFVLLAGRLPGTMLRAGLDRLLDALLPQQLEDRADRAHRDRGLTIRLKADGSGYTVVRGDLDLETGEYVLAVIAAAKTTDPDNPTDTAAWTTQQRLLHDGPNGDPSDLADLDGSGPEPRSRVQQDHDALKLALRRLLDSGALGLRGKTAPHLVVTVGVAAVHSEPGALPAVSSAGTRLPAGLVRTLLCDSRLTRLVLSLGHRVLDVSHTERTLKAHERLALHTRWGGRCAEAGCTSPPGTPLVPHHADPWHTTGSTALTDSLPLCQTTHHHLHVRGQTLTLRDGRRLGPHGWVRGPDR